MNLSEYMYKSIRNDALSLSFSLIIKNTDDECRKMSPKRLKKSKKSLKISSTKN